MTLLLLLPSLCLAGDPDTGDLTGPDGVEPWPLLVRWLLVAMDYSAREVAG